MSPLAGWDNFYVIVGSAAGALIGLQFVVITLIADTRSGRRAAQASEAFATPTIVYFSTVLLLSAIINAPWHAIHPAASIWGAIGVIGLIYVAITTRRMRIQTAYKPEFEDWLFHALLPFAAFVSLIYSAFAVRTNAYKPMFAVAAAALLLLFAGIHNAWDGVTYHVFVVRSRQRGSDQPPSPDTPNSDPISGE